MTIEKLCAEIGLSKTAAEFLEQYEMEKKLCEDWKNLFLGDCKEFLKRSQEGFIKEDKRAGFYLYMAVQIAADVYVSFKEQGFSDAFYYLNMKDIAIWERDYEKKTGKAGLLEFSWVAYSLLQKLYRIGRLQFEPYILGKTVTVCGKVYEKGTEVLNVHIPEDGRLLPEACEVSFCEAEKFFAERGYKGAGTFICESWLLVPELQEILSENSNLIRFQKHFHVFELIYLFRQTEERVFGEIRPDVENYPENSSLQRAVKRRLMKNPADFGMGIGIFELL